MKRSFKQLPVALSFSLIAACGAPGDVTISNGVGDNSNPEKGAPLSDSPDDGVARLVIKRSLPPAGLHGSTEKVIGVNDLVPVINDGANVPSVYRSYVDAFGLMGMGCTATYIGNGLALSAGHCFGAPETEVRDVACSNMTSDTGIDWGKRKDKSAYLHSNCTRILAARYSDDADYAIFRVDTAPRASVPVTLDAKPGVNTRITIFGHPQMRPLEWSQTCVVRPAADGGWGLNQFSHQCDTEPGSSGSTVLTADGASVIGIHDGGVSDGQGGGWNYATFLFDTPLREFMDGGSTDDRPTRLSFGPFTNYEDRTLTTLGRQGETVSFTLTSNTESGYDFVIVTDASGRQWRQSGKSTRVFGTGQQLTAPISVRFTSDYSVTSASVVLESISYAD